MAINGKKVVLPYIVRPVELTLPRTAEYHEPSQSPCSSTRMTPDGKGRCVSTYQLPLIMRQRKQNYLSRPQDHYGYWKYGTTDWITRLMYTGQLPGTFFEHVSNKGIRSSNIKDRPFLYNVEPTVEPPDSKKAQLWEPKKVDRMQTAKRIYFDVLNARIRKKDIMEQFVRKKEQNKQHQEEILLKHSENMSKSLEAYLNKLDRTRQTYKAKMQRKSHIGIVVPLKQ